MEMLEPVSSEPLIRSAGMLTTGDNTVTYQFRPSRLGIPVSVVTRTSDTSGRASNAADTCAVVAVVGIGAVHTLPENDSVSEPPSSVLPGSCTLEMLTVVFARAAVKLTFTTAKDGYGAVDGQLVKLTLKLVVLVAICSIASGPGWRCKCDNMGIQVY